MLFELLGTPAVVGQRDTALTRLQQGKWRVSKKATNYPDLQEQHQLQEGAERLPEHQESESLPTDPREEFHHGN